MGVDACLVVTPYYSKPPQNGLLAHYRAIAEAVDIPLVLYDVPPRTSRRIERTTVVELAGLNNIVADKDAVGDASETAKLRAELDAAGHTDFDLYCGDDPMLLPHLAAGCVGVVSVCSHIIGPQIKQIFSAWNDGKIDEAQRIFAAHLGLISVLMGVTTSPIPVKYAIGLLGVQVGEPRLPLVPPTDDEARTIRSAMEKIGLL
jgi:4-hydroxy-tetrahydrodipicolinate synthase